MLCVNLGSRTAKLTMLDVPAGAKAGEPVAAVADRETALESIADDEHLTALDAASADVVAYRIVRTTDSSGALAAPFDEHARAGIEAAREFASLHAGPELAAFDGLRARLPRARHVAVFDSAFHNTIAPAAAVYGLPYDAFAQGWRKIGFHGLSHSYAAARSAVLLGDAEPVRKLVSAHLGGGASACAIDGARSVDTTMGFTPLDGLIMATRSGSLDPGLLLAYMRRYGLSPQAAEDELTNRSGLLGLGGSADMREILTLRERGDPRAALAFGAFVYRVAGAIGAMTAALAGLDAIAFLGGIGENSSEIRAAACAPFAFLGAGIDVTRNRTAAGDVLISSPGARVSVLRIHAREDWMMALAALTVA